jgi:hypothetical protein
MAAEMEDEMDELADMHAAGAADMQAAGAEEDALPAPGAPPAQPIALQLGQADESAVMLAGGGGGPEAALPAAEPPQ